MPSAPETRRGLPISTPGSVAAGRPLPWLQFVGMALVGWLASGCQQTPPAAPGPEGPARNAIEEPAEERVEKGVVIGQVLAVDRPFPDILVQLASIEDPDLLQQARTNARGEFAIVEVPPGRYLLTATDVTRLRTGVHAQKHRPVDMPVAALIEVELVFGKGAAVHGPLVGLPADPTAHHVIGLYHPGGPSVSSTPVGVRSHQLEAARHLVASCAVSGGDDEYHIPDVEPGTYLLDVQPLPGPDARPTDLWPASLYRASIEVPAGGLRHPIIIP